MNAVRLCIMLLVAAALPLVVQAEVYKWKDKDGTVRYSDTPPPTNIKTETVVKKKPVTPQAASGAPSTKVIAQPKSVVVPETPDAAAERRREQAEVDKRNKQEKEAEAQRKAENCTAARTNMETYTQGGRIYKVNEKGERVYMDNTDFELERQKAQKEINENC